MKLYELVGQDPTQGFSPYVWRTRMALAHKGFEPEMVPLRFTQIADELAFADSRTVPVLVDGDEVITDSWHIACYLEETYPERPSLFGGEVGRVQARHFNMSSFNHLVMPLFKAIVGEIFEMLEEEDQIYFRRSREKRLGKALEEMEEHREENLNLFAANLWPYEQTLKEYDYFGGSSPTYCDYILYGIFQWARGTSRARLVDENSSLVDWQFRMDNLFDGLGGRLQQRS
ncbi:glutathione S-transferase family protein [Emcibacter sp.]|uniref:glutathione S-transferase family protein n=1 Tax=Emcibacter sp. TaxID=1979954 RepID=UPI002AA87344|nr:glutathione S-transferase family protein [Emcibacter sp.]